MSKPDSGSSGLGASRPISPSRSAANAGGFSASGGDGLKNLAGRLTEASRPPAAAKPTGRVYSEGRFEIKKIYDKSVGRNADRGQVWEVSDGVETAKAYSLQSAREVARHMMDVPKAERDAKRDAMLAQLRHK